MKTTDFITENQFIGDDAHAMHQDHEVQMARGDCYTAAKYAIGLHKMLKNIDETTGLDGWVSEKLTLANDYLRTVHEYLSHEMSHPEEDMPEVFTAALAEARFAELLGEDPQEEFAKARQAKRDAKDTMWAAGKGSGKHAEDEFAKGRQAKRDAEDDMWAAGKGKRNGMSEQFDPATKMMWIDQVSQLAQAVSQMSPEELVKLNDAFQGFYRVAGGVTAGAASVGIGNMFYELLKDTLYAAKNKARVDTDEILTLQRQIISIHKMLKKVKTEPAIAKYQAMLKQAYEVLAELEARQGNQVAEAAKWRTHPDAHDYDTDGSPMPKGGIKRDPLTIRQGVSKTQSEKDPKSLAGKFGDKYAKKHGVPTKQLMKNIPLDDIDEQGVAEGKPQKRADRYHINKDGKPATLASYADKSSAVKDRDARYPDAKVHQVGPRGKVKGEFEEGMAEGYWQDALKKVEADREARKGKPFEKNPASHDKQGVYKGDKDLAGNPVPKRKEQGVTENAYQTQQLIQQHADMLGRSAAQLTQGDLDQLTQLGFSIGIGAAAGVAGVIGGYELGDRFISLINKTMRMIKKKAEVDTEEIIQLQRQIVSIHKRLKTLKSEPAIAKYQAMLKQAYEVLEELEARQGNQVAEAAKKGLYYNVNKRKAAGTSRSASNPKAPTDQAWKDAAKTAKTEGVAETTSSAGMATAPGVGKGPATGTLFGGSYAPRTPFTAKKKTSVIKR